MNITSGKASPITFEGIPRNKIGVEEFQELADLWGYSPAVREKIRELLETETVDSPHLARYYGTRPSKVSSLEEYSQELFGVKYALAVNSGTSALNAAYVGCGIGPGDEVIVPGYTFIATPVAVLTAKAIPVVAEIDDSLTIDPADVERKITPRTKAIVPVHMLGLSADMDAIMAIARKHGLIVIEDAAQACAGKYKGKFLGTIGNAGIFSISSFKRVGGGEGGMVVTNDGQIFARAKMYHDAAAAWRPDRYRAEEHAGDLFYGQNYRMSELEGAVNLVQLKKGKELVERLIANSRLVLSQLDEFASVRQRRSNSADDDVGLIFLASDKSLVTSIVADLQSEGLRAGGRGTAGARDWHIYSYWQHLIDRRTPSADGCPFTCPYYKGNYRLTADACPTTIDVMDRMLSVEVSPWWTSRDCDQVAEALNRVFAS